MEKRPLGRVPKKSAEMIEKYRGELPLSAFICAEHRRYFVEFDRFFPYYMTRCYCTICLEEIFNGK